MSKGSEIKNNFIGGVLFMKATKRILALTLVGALALGSAFAGTGNNGFQTGKLSGKSAEAKAAIALKFMEKKGDFKVTKESKDALGITTVRVQQYYNNVPVYGSDQIVNIAEDGVVNSFVGFTQDLNLTKKIDKKVSKHEAIAIAKAEVGSELIDAPKADIVVYIDGETPHYVYQMELVTEMARWNYFVETSTGKVIAKFNSITGGKPAPRMSAANTVAMTGTGVLNIARTFNGNLNAGQYYLADLSKGNGIYTYNANYRTRLPGSLWSDADGLLNASYDKAAVSSQYFFGVTYDYFMDTFGRDSFDNRGAQIKSSVHVGRSYNNAYWNGSQFAFGDGDNNTFIPLSGAIDVVAHEFMHAVTENTANLTYSYESGALNEAMSDIFGTAVEFYANENPDWLIGEDISGPGLGAPALRSMADPTITNDPDHYSVRYTGSQDNGGVHINSNIINKAAYLFAVGGTHYGVTVQGQGVEAMENVFWRALNTYMTSGTNFAQGRVACVQATTDLYGAGSAQVEAMNDAFDSIGVN